MRSIHAVHLAGCAGIGFDRSCGGQRLFVALQCILQEPYLRVEDLPKEVPVEIVQSPCISPAEPAVPAMELPPEVG